MTGKYSLAERTGLIILILKKNNFKALIDENTDNIRKNIIKMTNDKLRLTIKMTNAQKKPFRLH